MTPPLEQLYQLWRDVQHPGIVWQLGLVAAALAVGALAAFLATRRDAQEEAAGKPHLGHKAVRELAFPLAALAVLLVGRPALHAAHDGALVSFFIALLTALAILRFALLLVRQVFAPGARRGVTRFVAWLVWTGFALHITGLAPLVLDALEAAHFSIGKQNISVLLVLQAALSVVTAVLVALWLGRYVETRLMAAESVQVSLRVMLTKLAKALLVLLAVLIALPAVGIDVTALSVFGGMLGVGIGFGLQKIASNYVSGFIILMDRSVSLGDVIQVEQHIGRVTKLTARYIVVRNRAGTEALIPNERLIGESLINYTYTDRRVHVPVEVQVAYGTEMDGVARMLEQIASAHPRVLSDPAPAVLIKTLADSAVTLELGVWIDDPEDGIGNVRSDLYFEILRRFSAAGIEIPYPQRDLRIRSMPPAPSMEKSSATST